jgi:hypothetical protein
LNMRDEGEEGDIGGKGGKGVSTYTRLYFYIRSGDDDDDDVVLVRFEFLFCSVSNGMTLIGMGRLKEERKKSWIGWFRRLFGYR